MLQRLSLWGLTPGRVRDDLHLPGSPERCVKRMALEDSNDRVWMLEKLRPGQFDRRERIGRVLRQLSDAGLPVPAYRPGPGGTFAVEQEQGYFQLSPYIPGDPLPQPDFIEDADRGQSLGQFLVGLHLEGSLIHDFDLEPEFILEDYVNELIATMGPRQPEAHEVLLPVLPALTPLFEAWHDLPTTLSHGDFHPLNIIWREKSVAAVIDWEFSAQRPTLFDTANCLGCVGIEDPTALVRGLAPALLRTLRDADCLDETSFSLLPEMILGLRFAWMSEWLRRQDKEMTDIELRFMRLLTNSIDTLRPAWDKLLGE